MDKKYLIALLTIITPFSFSFGQRLPLPYLKEVPVECITSYERNQQMFYYTYNVANGVSSIGNIGTINIDVSETTNAVEYDTVGLRFRNDGFTEQIFRNDYPSVQGKIVPVGFPSSPEFWDGGISLSLEAGFDGDTLFIDPGHSLGGFVMMSKGLPGIRKFTASPDFDPTQYLPDPDVYPDSAVNMDSLQGTLNYYGWTIGPTAPPLDFSGTSWIDTLASYKHQCVALGWLSDGSAYEKVEDPARVNEDDDRAGEGIVERLDRRLDKAKDALAKSDSVKARLELELFVKEVEQLYHKNKEEGERRGVPVLTSEGYALLKYNAQYLIDRLPEKHGRGDEGERRGKK